MSIKRIPYSAPREEFISAIEKDGCVIIQNFTTKEKLARAQSEVQPYLDADGEMSKVGALNGGTRTCTKLIGRSKTVREEFFSDPLYQDLSEHFLSLTTTNYYNTEPSTNTTHPLLSIAITMDIRPGAAAQRLHRDDKNHHARHVRTSSYSYEPHRDMLLGLFVPGCDTTKEIGATRVVPGSHLWGDEKPDFGPDGCKGVVDAEMKAGDAFVMLGSLYHGGGEFMKDSGSRTVHIMFMCSGVYRQEEISYLSYPIEEVKTYSKLVQERLGWKQSEPNLGWVDLKSPEFMLE
ncbi:hypothetical protein C8Q69DRAFT_468735 [Paecilomyces variotii]|uniref:Phytanoyl-CoA dioxygenase family protein n=1 Tax=Byssochlamys spectabilis TaxID=264951 RepID=A0A443HTB7_BYSSP|nr:hypothetical protein C8Q69DRAFT_468735 [Paecilomyces variotii]RWQ95056.1 hypothetical protein C8Q69DRAFT_468735 [Paecilomyces variotii]